MKHLKLFREIYESIEENGLQLIPSTENDSRIIKDAIANSDFYSEYNDEFGYYFFPEEEYAYDELEAQLHNLLAGLNVNYRIEGVFSSNERLQLNEGILGRGIGIALITLLTMLQTKAQEPVNVGASLQYLSNSKPIEQKDINQDDANKAIVDISNKIIEELDKFDAFGYDSKHQSSIIILKKLINTYITGLQMGLEGENYSKDMLKRILVELSELIRELQNEEYGQAPENTILDIELRELITLYRTDNPLFKHKHNSYKVLLREYNKVYQMYVRLNQSNDNKYSMLYAVALLIIIICISSLLIIPYFDVKKQLKKH